MEYKSSSFDTATPAIKWVIGWKGTHIHSIHQDLSHYAEEHIFPLCNHTKHMSSAYLFPRSSEKKHKSVQCYINALERLPFGKVSLTG